MNKNIFKYLRKKILQYSTITNKLDGNFIIYKIESLGFVEEIILPSQDVTKDFTTKKPLKDFTNGLLIDRLVQNSEFLEKLEQVENRENNLKSLLD